MESIFSGLADEILEDLHAGLTEKYGRRMLDESLPAEKRRLGALINEACPPSGAPHPACCTAAAENDDAGNGAAGFSSREIEQSFVQGCVKEVLVRQLKNLALAIYLCMSKKKDWGAAGEDRTADSFCRSIMRIPCDRVITPVDMLSFRHIVGTFDAETGKKSGDEMAGYCKSKKISLFGGEFSLYEISEIIKLLEADYYLYSNPGPFCTEFIFGEVTWTEIAGTPIYIFQDEYIRSPMHHLSIAGRAPSPMQIRRVSLEIICFNKWQGILDYSEAEKRIIRRHPYNAIGEKITEKAMALYGIRGGDDFTKKKDALIDDMIDGVIWHEFGHEISQSDMEPVHSAIRGNIREEDTASCAIEELLSDWAPERGGKKGAVARFLELSNSKIDEAAALFYVFLSDNWYVSDNDEGYLQIRSRVYLSLGLYFLGAGGSVDFDRIARERDVIYAFLLEQFRSLMERLMGLITQGSFLIGGRQTGCGGLEAEILGRLRQKDEALTPEAMKKSYSYWSEVISCLKAAPEGRLQFRDFLDREAAALEQEVLKLVSGGNAAAYGNSLWSYILDRCGKTGIYTPPKATDSRETVRKACEKLKFSRERFIPVYERFEKILKGEQITVSADCDYDCKPDPFIDALQEMILESNHREIRSALIDDTRGLGFRLENKKELAEFIREGVKDWRYQIEDGYYPYIELLRVNRRRVSRAAAGKILAGAGFPKGDSLKKNIREIEFLPLGDDIIMEALIPMRRGFMDWTTVMAVGRINNYIRPDNSMAWHTVDKFFLEILFEAYEFSIRGEGKYFPSAYDNGWMY
jgi:hypothetical protein